MNADRLMDALGKVNEDYIMESAPGKKANKKPHIRWIAAVIAVIIFLTFFQTAPGATALETVKEAVINFIETLFPPKEIPVMVEGDTEVVSQQAGGQEPERKEDETGTTPGFAIYYDPEQYVMTEENGVTYIRFNTENDLPPCEMAIQHVPHLAPADAAKAARQELAENWEQVSEVHPWGAGEGLVIDFSNGTNWDSACGESYFLSDGRDGCFQITTRYFVEAAEGHGVRFGQMVQNFEVIDPDIDS